MNILFFSHLRLQADGLIKGCSNLFHCPYVNVALFLTRALGNLSLYLKSIGRGKPDACSTQRSSALIQQDYDSIIDLISSSTVCSSPSHKFFATNLLSQPWFYCIKMFTSKSRCLQHMAKRRQRNSTGCRAARDTFFSCIPFTQYFVFFWRVWQV